MNLIVDIGNTRMKAAVFQGDQLKEKIFVDTNDTISIKEWVNKKEIQRAILLASGNVPEDLEVWLKHDFPYLRLDSNTPLPISSVYQTPETLGKDRVAAVVGAFYEYPQQTCLVIDAGTCVTYDIINNKGVYMGGNIAPGIDMRLQAMDEFTASLPKVSKSPLNTDRGFTTETAMRAGAAWGLILESEGFARRFSKQMGNIRVILTGGDAPILDNHMEWDTLIDEDLVFKGLNKILAYNDASF